MDTETLLPLVTFILGLAGAMVTEAFRDRRASNRERQARQAELQRTALLELQDMLLELFNLANNLFLARLATTRDHPDEDAKMEVEERERQARSHSRDTSARVRLLSSRIQDVEVRKSVTHFEKAEGEHLARLLSAYNVAIEQLGELLRERY
jgi:hypothetical protein